MGSFDGTEVCELVGLYLLNKIKPLLGSSKVELYRDDELAVVHKANSPNLTHFYTYIQNPLTHRQLSNYRS